MKRGLCIFYLALMLAFSVSLPAFASTETEEWTQAVLKEYAGEWASVSVYGFYLLDIEAINDRNDRLHIELNIEAPKFQKHVLTGQVEMVDQSAGNVQYVFDPESEASYTDGYLEFLLNKTLKLTYIDVDNKQHTIVFHRKKK